MVVDNDPCALVVGLGAGDGTFDATMVQPLPNWGHCEGSAVQVADLDGDQVIDVAVVLASLGVYVLRGRPATITRGSISIRSPVYVLSLADE